MLVRAFTMFAAISLLCGATDVITLRDGRTISGSYLGGDSRQVRMVVGEKIHSFSIPDVARIEFGNTATSSAPPPTPAPASNAGEERNLRPSRVSNHQNTPEPSALDIPAGTQLVVRLIDPVDSETDRIGQTYRASLDEPVVVSGETLVPRGADIVAKLVDDKQSGRISGSTVLTLDLMSISINGRLTDITTQEVTQSSGSRTARSGKIIGGTAALGAIIGAIAGGGKGAAIGGVAGAGAGTAAEVMTKGQRVRIPSETRLTFSLQNPVRL